MTWSGQTAVRSSVARAPVKLSLLVSNKFCPAAILTAQNAAQQLHNHSRKRSLRMKYLFGWILGIPGGLIVIWFLFNHLH